MPLGQPGHPAAVLVERRRELVIQARHHHEVWCGDVGSGQRPPLLPGFAVAFAVLVAINSTGWIPKALSTFGSDASRWFLVTAIAGIGMKTQLKELATVGFKPVALMIGETVFLAALVVVLMRWIT